MNIEQTEIRRNIHKNKDILATSGYGIIVLVVWGIIKGIIYLRWIVPQLADSSDQIYSWSITGANIVEFVLCLITGFIAKKYGKSDKKERPVLVILTILLIFFGLAVIASDIFVLIQYKNYDLISIISFISDFMFMLFICLILVSFFKLKKFYKMQGEVEYER